MAAGSQPSPTSAPAPAPAPGPKAGERNVEPPAPAISATLRAEFGRAVRRLNDELPHDQRTPDLMSLIGQLAGDPEGRLRQPPAAAQRAMAACKNENVPAKALVALLEQDPMLAQSVLSRANSAYYHRGGLPCLALDDAITRQGRGSVHNVLLEQTLNGLIYSPGGGWNDVVGQVWSHMVRTGPIARAIAPVFDVDPEEAFALALLHDVGKLAVFDRIAMLRTAQRSNLDLPRPALGLTLRLLHESLGGLCALGWGFGDAAAAAIATHHRAPVPAEPNVLSEVICLAERAELAIQRDRLLDLPALWRTAGLSGDPDAALAALAEFTAIPTASW